MADFMYPYGGARVLQMGRAAQRAHVRVHNAGDDGAPADAPPRQLLRFGAAAQNAALRQKGEEIISHGPWLPPQIIARAPTVLTGAVPYVQGLVNAFPETRENEQGGQYEQWQHAKGPLVLQSGGVARWRVLRDGKAQGENPPENARQLLHQGGVRTHFAVYQYLPDRPEKNLLRFHGAQGPVGASTPLKDIGWQSSREVVWFAWSGLLQPQDLYESGYETDRSILHIGGAGVDVPPAHAPYVRRTPRGARIVSHMGGIAATNALKDRNRSYENGWHLLNHRLLKIGTVVGVQAIKPHPNAYIGLRKPLSIGRVSFERALQVKNGIYAYQLLGFGRPLAARDLKQGLREEFRQLLRMAAAGPVHDSTAPNALQQEGGARVLRFAMPAPRNLHHGNYKPPIYPPPTESWKPKYYAVPHRHIVRTPFFFGPIELFPRDAPKVRRALRIGNASSDGQLEQQSIAPLPPSYFETGPRPDVVQMGRHTYDPQLLDNKGRGWKETQPGSGHYSYIDYEQQRSVLHMGDAGPLDAPIIVPEQWDSSWFPIYGMLPMPWGLTLVDALVHSQRLVGQMVGIWALQGGKWSHDNGMAGPGHGKMGAALDGGGVWEITGSDDTDGSTWGTLSGHGTWHKTGVSKKEYYDESAGTFAISRVHYTGGTWGGFGSWHLTAQGELSLQFTIHKGGGWRLVNLFSFSGAPIALRGEGFTPGAPIYENGEGGKETLFSSIGGGGGIYSSPGADHDNPGTWFKNLKYGEILPAGSGADELYQRENSPKPKTPEDLPPVEDAPPDGSGGGGTSDGKGGPPPLPDADPRNNPHFTFLFSTNQIGPANGLTLPAPPPKGQAPRAMGSIASAAVPEYVDGGSIRIAGFASAQTDSFAGIHETIRARERVTIHALARIQETARAFAAVSANAAIHVREAARAFATASAHSASTAHIADTVRAFGVARVESVAHVAEAIRAFGSASAQGEIRIAETIRAFAGARASSHTQAAIHEGLHARASAWGISSTSAHIAESIHAADCIWAKDSAACAWVLVPESSAVHFWDNWQFASMAQMGEKIFAAGPNGLALLGAPTDAGAPIAARVQYGFSELAGFYDDGSPKPDTAKKRVPYLYFGYTANGVLQATCETYGQGLPIFRYAMPAAPAAQPATSRIAIGKGLHARYWRIGIENTAGCDFAVHSIAAEIAPGKRRI